MHATSIDAELCNVMEEIHKLRRNKYNMDMRIFHKNCSIDSNKF